MWSQCRSFSPRSTSTLQRRIPARAFQIFWVRFLKQCSFFHLVLKPRHTWLHQDKLKLSNPCTWAQPMYLCTEPRFTRLIRWVSLQETWVDSSASSSAPASLLASKLSCTSSRKSPDSASTSSRVFLCTSTTLEAVQDCLFIATPFRLRREFTIVPRIWFLLRSDHHPEHFFPEWEANGEVNSSLSGPMLVQTQSPSIPRLLYTLRLILLDNLRAFSFSCV